jgi:hypothetical protein
MTGVGMFAVINVERTGQMRLVLGAARDGQLTTEEQEAKALAITCTKATSTDEKVDLIRQLRQLIPVRICVATEDAAKIEVRPTKGAVLS